MRKVFGGGQQRACALCGGIVTAKNEQGLLVCQRHVKESVTLRCVCGGFLDARDGKYGTFFLCMNCGPVNYNKGLEMNDLPLPSVEEL